MPIFKYTGYTSDGSFEKGVVEADNEQDAVLKLKDIKKILPKDIKRVTPGGKTKFFHRDKSKELELVTRHLSILAASGVSISDSLSSLSDEYTGYFKNILIDLKESISRGTSLSKAMGSYREIFPEFYIMMVHAGETGGMLDDVLMKLSDFLEKESDIKKKVSTALVYPVFMISIGFIVLSFIFAFVVPKIVVIFENSKAALPFITIVLLKMNSMVQSFWWLFIIIAIGLFFYIRKIIEKKPEVFDSFWLRIPLTRSLYLTRFTRILGFLLTGGVPLIHSLELAAGSAGNSVLKKNIQEASAKITEGIGIANALITFPPVLRQMIATGEKTGRLPILLEKAADVYENEFTKRVQVMLSILEPSMIVIMGIIVGFIVFAVLLPIFQMNQLIR